MCYRSVRYSRDANNFAKYTYIVVNEKSSSTIPQPIPGYPSLPPKRLTNSSVITCEISSGLCAGWCSDNYSGTSDSICSTWTTVCS